MKTQTASPDRRRLTLVFLATLVAVALSSSAACSSEDSADKAETADKPSEAKTDKLPEPDFKQPRIGLEWCDKLLETAECTAPRYKKREDRIEAAAVWKLRAKQWKDMPSDEANQACEKKYKDAASTAADYENGLLASCYK